MSPPDKLPVSTSPEEIESLLECVRRNQLGDFLESRRPPSCYSRLESWFTCDTPGKSARYLEAELTFNRTPATAAEPLLYSVETTAFSKQPMVLVKAILEALTQSDYETAKVLSTEYWQPTREWKFWEYTSRTILVVKKLPWPDSVEQTLAGLDYTKDSQQLTMFLK